MKSQEEKTALVNKWFTPEYLKELENELSKTKTMARRPMFKDAPLTDHAKWTLESVAEKKEEMYEAISEALDSFLEDHVIEMVVDGMLSKVRHDYILDGDNIPDEVVLKKDQLFEIDSILYTTVHLTKLIKVLTDGHQYIQNRERHIKDLKLGLII